MAARTPSQQEVRSGVYRRPAAQSDMHAQLQLFIAKESHHHAPWYIIRPISRFQSIWDLITSAALVFTALMTPYEVAFLAPALDGLFAVNRLIDAVFVMDMVFQFFIMYQNDREGVLVWEYRLRHIARRYMKGWFVLDLLSIVPTAFDILPLLSDGQDDEGTNPAKVLRVVRCARLLKLVRLVRGSRMIARWRTRISIPFSKIAIFTLAIEIVLCSHWMACVLMLTSTVFDHKADTWLGSFGWCARADDGSEDCVPTNMLYVVTVNWAFGLIAGSSPPPPPPPPLSPPSPPSHDVHLITFSSLTSSSRLRC